MLIIKHAVTIQRNLLFFLLLKIYFPTGTDVTNGICHHLPDNQKILIRDTSKTAYKHDSGETLERGILLAHFLQKHLQVTILHSRPL